MKKIPLSKGYEAMVDDEDFQFLIKFKWHVHEDRRSAYAGTMIDGKNIKMHWILLPTDKPMCVDHIDSNGLNNQKANLRRVTPGQNSQNKRKQFNCSSRYKGVYFDKVGGLWKAQIQIDSNRSKRKYLGRFKNEVDAALAYDRASREHFSHYAKVNFEGGNS